MFESIKLEPLSYPAIQQLHEQLQADELYALNDDDRLPLLEFRSRLEHAITERSPDNPAMTWLYRIVTARQQPVGMIEVGIFPDDYGEIGFVTFPQFQRHGFATQAVRAMLAQVWSRWPSMVVHAFTRKTNHPARKTLERVGFLRCDARLGMPPVPSDEYLYVACSDATDTPPSA